MTLWILIFLSYQLIRPYTYFTILHRDNISLCYLFVGDRLNRKKGTYELRYSNRCSRTLDIFFFFRVFFSRDSMGRILFCRPITMGTIVLFVWFHQGKFRMVCVSDHLPISEDNSVLLPLCENNKVLWLPLLVKGLLRVYALAEKFEQFNTITCLTGWTCIRKNCR